MADAGEDPVTKSADRGHGPPRCPEGIIFIIVRTTLRGRLISEKAGLMLAKTHAGETGRPAKGPKDALRTKSQVSKPAQLDKRDSIGQAAE